MPKREKTLPNDDQSLSERAQISAQDIEDAQAWAAEADPELGRILSAEPEPDAWGMAPPLFRWDARVRRYRRGGRFVSAGDVRRALDRAISTGDLTARALSLQLQQGQVSLATWQLGMEKLTKRAFLSASSAAQGGWQHMTPAAYGRTGVELKKQYAYLARFARQIQEGKQLLDGTVLVRAELYVEASRAFYHAEERREMEVVGFTEARSILHPADHCDLCVEEAAAGWRPSGQVIPIGQRTCRVRDRCSLQFRNPNSGEVRG